MRCPSSLRHRKQSECRRNARSHRLHSDRVGWQHVGIGTDWPFMLSHGIAESTIDSILKHSVFVPSTASPSVKTSSDMTMRATSSTLRAVWFREAMMMTPFAAFLEGTSCVSSRPFVGEPLAEHCSARGARNDRRSFLGPSAKQVVAAGRLQHSRTEAYLTLARSAMLRIARCRACSARCERAAKDGSPGPSAKKERCGRMSATKLNPKLGQRRRFWFELNL